MSRATEDRNRRMLRARDLMDQRYDQPLDIRALAAVAYCSPAHFVRSFRDTFGETPHRYLQRRRVERATHLLRTTTHAVTDICFAVGFSSLGTFSRTFTAILGESPSAFRVRTAGWSPDVPGCVERAWMRPSDEALLRVRRPSVLSG